MMNNVINDAVRKLSAVTQYDPIDWETFDRVLLGLENINLFDEKCEETILSQYIMDSNFYHRGEVMPEAIRHFLSCGYDPLAHEGRNGGLALSALCWSSYDRYILDAAKILLDAGAPIIYKSDDDDLMGSQPQGVLGTIDWKLSGLWSVNNDFVTANLFEAYYSIAKARVADKDYNSIDCFLGCIGQPLAAVSALNCENGDGLQNKGGIGKFADSLILRFGNKPLVVSNYISFVVNPVYVNDNKGRLEDVSSAFAPLIGAILQEIRYIDSIICYLEFDIGRVLLASCDIGNRNRIPTFEIQPVEDSKEISDLHIMSICGTKGKTYAGSTTKYEENSLALFCDDAAYLLYPMLDSYGKQQLSLLRCSKNLLTEYTRQFPLPKPESIACFYEHNGVGAVRLNYKDEFLYFKPTTDSEIEILLSDHAFDPQMCSSLHDKQGKHIKFTERKA